MQVDTRSLMPKFKTKAAQIVWQLRDLTDRAFLEEQAELTQLKADLEDVSQKIEECKQLSDVSYTEINNVQQKTLLLMRQVFSIA